MIKTLTGTVSTNKKPLGRGLWSISSQKTQLIRGALLPTLEPRIHTQTKDADGQCPIIKRSIVFPSLTKAVKWTSAFYNFQQSSKQRVCVLEWEGGGNVLINP